MGILKAIGGFIGAVLKAILPALLREWKKPRDVKPIGHDPDIQDDISAGIEERAGVRSDTPTTRIDTGPMGNGEDGTG